MDNILPICGYVALGVLLVLVLLVLVRVCQQKMFATVVWNNSSVQRLKELDLEEMTKWLDRQCEILLEKSPNEAPSALVLIPGTMANEMLDKTTLSSSDKKNACVVTITGGSSNKVILAKVIITPKIPTQIAENFAKGNVYSIPIET